MSPQFMMLLEKEIWLGIRAVLNQLSSEHKIFP